MARNQKLPWTREEIDRLKESLRREITEIEGEFPDAKPLPPMSIEECMELFSALMDSAHERPLTREECLLHGQLLCVFQMAVRADTLWGGLAATSL
jgi:hypothetical protein